MFDGIVMPRPGLLRLRGVLRGDRRNFDVPLTCDRMVELRRLEPLALPAEIGSELC